MPMPRPVSHLIGGVRLRAAPRAEAGAATLWPVPVAAGAVAVVAAAVLVAWEPAHDTVVADWAWPGGRDTGTAMLQIIPTAVMTATAVTFSLVVVALQMSSQQFSPRLLRQFTRDRVFKMVLGVLVSAFAFPVTVLRGLDDGEDLPRVAMFVTFLLGLASLVALISFIAHTARSLRVDTMMVTVHGETRRAIERFYEEGSSDALLSECGLPPGDGVLVRSRRSGFVRIVDVDGLMRRAKDEGWTIKLEVRPGDHVVQLTPLALAWCDDGEVDVEQVANLVHSRVDIGYERTLEQDPSFGFRELTDIAVKAMSPALNDPVTADHAIGHMADLLVRVTQRRLGPKAHRDDEGAVRLVAVDRDFRYYLDLPCGQIRRFGSHEPTVLLSLLRMLRNVATVCQDDARRAEVRRQVRLIIATMDEAAGEDREALEEMGDRVELALAGDVLGAFKDRAGVTRSM